MRCDMIVQSINERLRQENIDERWRLMACLVSVFKNCFLFSRKKNTFGKWVCCQFPLFFVFSENNKMLFPLFFLLFKEQKKWVISPCFQSAVLLVFSVIFPPPARSVLSPLAHLLFPLFPNILKFFLLNLDDFGRLEKLVGQMLDQRFSIIFMNYCSLWVCSALFLEHNLIIFWILQPFFFSIYL